MSKTGVLIIFGVVTLLMVSLGITIFRFSTSPSNMRTANDFYQRHPDWTWSASTPVAAASDYFQRHPELSKPAILGLGASDYIQRHPELMAPAQASADLTDYYFRQQAQKSSGPDLTEYYFRHSS